MDPSIEPIMTIGSVVVILAGMIYFNRNLDNKIEDKCDSLGRKIDDTRSALDAKIDATHSALDTKIDDTRVALEAKIEKNSDRIDALRLELKVDITAVANSANRANEYHIEIRGDLKALTEKVDCIQQQVERIERASA